MTETKHTPEPWSIEGADPEFRIIATEDEMIGSVGNGWKSPSINGANARRIVACVNYCATLSTESLESATAGGKGVARLAALEKVRDAAERTALVLDDDEIYSDLRSALAAVDKLEQDTT